MKCTENVRNVYDAMLQEDIRKLLLADQSWFNFRLKDFPVKWDLQPYTFYAWSQHPVAPAKDIILHHANCTGGPNGLAKKIQQLEFVRRKIENECDL